MISLIPCLYAFFSFFISYIFLLSRVLILTSLHSAIFLFGFFETRTHQPIRKRRSILAHSIA